MKVLLVTAILLWTSVAANPPPTDTCDRVIRHGYSCLKYTVTTSDGYKLATFRMQRSHLPNNQMEGNKSAVLLMHGLLSSSDIWVLNGPNDGLTYLLADAGYDVWLGNARGNDYSQEHVYLSPLSPKYWEFCWHEIGMIDIPALIDFIISTTGQTSVHYVGHSQGCTAFMVMLSNNPGYNGKIKTSHLLAPPIFMEHMKSPGAAIAGPALGNPTLLSALLGTSQLNPSDDFIRLIAPEICKNEPAQPLCNTFLILCAGGPSPYTNFSTFEDLFETHPSSAAARQAVHYLQERSSGKFRPYDYGLITNYLVYGSFKPADYMLENVNTSGRPVNLYYSDNDDMVSAVDVQHLKSILGERVALHHVQYPEFNHVDYVLATNVREVICDPVVQEINEYENSSN